MGEDNWIHRSQKMRCATCMYYVLKAVDSTRPQDDESVEVGRCRRHAPTMSGWPVMFGKADWCGDHKLDENKV